MTITAELSSDTVARSCGIEIKSPSPVLSLCRELVMQGCDPVRPMEVYRGSTLALHIRSIGEAAKLEVGGHGWGFTRARDGGSAPPVSLTGPSSLAA
jgi:hypothetical protein